MLIGLAVLSTALILFGGRVARQQHVADGWRIHRVQVLLDAERLVSSLQDVQRGERGYLITGDPAFLAPYEAGLPRVERHLSALQRLTRNNPVQQARLAEIDQVVGRGLAQYAETVRLRREGQEEAAVALVRGGEGKRTQDQARALLADVIVEEERLLLVSRAQQREAARTAQAVSASLGLLGVLLLISAAGLGAVALRAVNRAKLTAELEAEVAARTRELSEANEKLVSEAQQREQLEGQLRQAQKMEAIGQLTGGIAHDFNNMLMVVLGSLDVLSRRLERGDTNVHRFVDAAKEGAQRSAALTAQLLAFARKQALEPKPVDANKLAGGMSDLLRRAVGETVRLEVVLAGGLWRTLADPAQLESALLNFAVNARDAMSGGGKLTVETANADLGDAYAQDAGVPPGQYVLIAVSDTGTGMSPEVAAQAFDPFFTTKEVGQGSGLGLSQVYGFVKQSGGHVKIYSEPGHGSTIKIYLPRFFGEAQSEPTVTSRPAPAPGCETVLLVEDEEGVRRVNAEGLRELGYEVLEADGASAALRELDANPGVCLLFTDIVMPEVNGRKLAEEALRRRPDLKVLYTTGYTRNAVVHNGVLDPGVDLISKPFTLAQLAAKLRSVLEEDGTASNPEATLRSWGAMEER